MIDARGSYGTSRALRYCPSDDSALDGFGELVLPVSVRFTWVAGTVLAPADALTALLVQKIAGRLEFRRTVAKVARG